MKLLKYLVAVILFILPVVSDARASETVDHSIFDGLLRAHVKAGVVDYHSLKKAERVLDTYLALLEKVKPERVSEDERFAFYINAYNAWTIKLILSGYPGVKSIKDLASWPGSPWKKEICRIDGRVISLDEIEHKILRPVFQDARVHFAINCAAKSCPPIRGEAYTGKKVHAQLDDSTRLFINDPASTYVDGKKLHVSRIFKWFKKDFNGDVIGFVARYAQGVLKEKLERQKKDLKIKYLDYDWSLNGR